MGIIPFLRFSTRFSSTSSATTRLPRSAKQAAVTRPTYPTPITQICFMLLYLFVPLVFPHKQDQAFINSITVTFFREGSYHSIGLFLGSCESSSFLYSRQMRLRSSSESHPCEWASRRTHHNRPPSRAYARPVRYGRSARRGESIL